MHFIILFNKKIYLFTTHIHNKSETKEKKITIFTRNDRYQTHLYSIVEIPMNSYVNMCVSVNGDGGGII